MQGEVKTPSVRHMPDRLEACNRVLSNPSTSASADHTACSQLCDAQHRHVLKVKTGACL